MPHQQYDPDFGKGERYPVSICSILKPPLPRREGMSRVTWLVEAIQGVLRVLKPSGKLIFFEHALSPRSSSASLAKAIRTA
jgi:hypothetical protein